ncbi:MAG: CHAT domain-containing protein [Bacteroides uniformis]
MSNRIKVVLRGRWNCRAAQRIEKGRLPTPSLSHCWDVNDHATQLLMIQFYRNLLKGKNKIESLHDAQTYVRNYEIEVETGVGKQQWKSRVRQEIDKTKEKSASPQTTKIKKYQDPYYWAAFFLIDAI